MVALQLSPELSERVSCDRLLLRTDSRIGLGAGVYIWGPLTLNKPIIFEK